MYYKAKLTDLESLTIRNNVKLIFSHGQDFLNKIYFPEICIPKDGPDQGSWSLAICILKVDFCFTKVII